MVLKTAEGISGIAEESQGVNLFVAQKSLLLPSWQSGSKPTLPSTGLLTLAFLGFF